MTDDKDREIVDLKARVAALEQDGAAQLSAMAVKKRTGIPVWAWVVGGFIGLVVIMNLAQGTRAPRSDETNEVPASNSTSAAEPASTGNLMNDALLKKPAATQAHILGQAVGEGCRGKRAFYDGIGQQGISAGVAYWSVGCRNGRTYMVGISSDDRDNKVIECSLIRAVAGVDCFTRF